MSTSDRRAREFKRRQREIIDAAVQLLSERNWEAVTVAQITAQAEVAKGTFYKHFSSKDELIGHIVLDERRDFYWKLKQAMDPGMLADVEAIANRIVAVCFQRYLSNPRFMQRLDQYLERQDLSAVLPPELTRELASVDRGMQALFWEGLGAGMQEGIFAAGDLQLRMTAAWATVNGALRLLASAGHGDFLGVGVEAFQAEVARFILRGLGWSEAE